MPPDRPVVDVMRKKYGDKSLENLKVWTAEFWVIRGSLSLKNVPKLEEKPCIHDTFHGAWPNLIV